MAAEPDGMLDTRTTTRSESYSWRTKFEVYTNLVDMDDHLEAVSQSFITTKELDALAMANQQNTSHFALCHI